MPIIKSAKKRVKTAHKAAVRNSKTKRSLKSALKGFHKSLTGAKKDAPTLQSKAQSELDKAVKKGIMHKNKAARVKKQLAAKSKAAGAATSVSAKKKAAPKKAATKPAAKAAKTTKAAPKAVAKKPVAKKPAAKKTTKK